jgi:diacylglycerol O-acyltransferase / wax synthase
MSAEGEEECGHERLRGSDLYWLALERATNPMFVGGVDIFDGDSPALRQPLDVATLRSVIEGRLDAVPQLRRRIRWFSTLMAPVWEDDPAFSIANHVHLVHLRPPGSVDAFCELVGELCAAQPRPSRPPWSLWFVDGLPDDRFAIVSQFHHSLMDGAAAVEVMSLILRPSPDARIEGDAPPWRPRPGAGWLRVAADEARHRGSSAARMMRAAIDRGREPGALIGSLWRAVWTAGQSVAHALSPAPGTPLNGATDGMRATGFATVPLATIKSVAKRHSHTINDVVLALVAGALRRVLRGQGLRLEETTIRALVPRSLRSGSEPSGSGGNRVGEARVLLPVEIDGATDLLHVAATRMKEALQEEPFFGSALADDAAGFMGPWFVNAVAGIAERARPFDLSITNIPGPQFPLYFLDGKLRWHFPLVPLLPGMGLVIAVFSYDGSLGWSVISDATRSPMIEPLIDGLRATLREMAGSEVLEDSVAPFARLGSLWSALDATSA